MAGRMVPLRLEWTMVSPMVAGAHPLHLDALVAYAVTEEALRNGAPPEANVRDLADELPLEKAEQGGDWCWKASVLQGKSDGHSMRMWTRKTDVYDIAERSVNQQLEGRFKLPLKPYAGKIDTARGLTKDFFKFFPVKDMKQATAWCIGDADRLGELLDPEAGLVTHLGAKTRMGFGRVGRFSIHADDSAMQAWQARVLPWESDGAVPVRMAARPPYWAPENAVNAFVVPGLF